MDGQEVLGCTDVDPLTDRPMKQMRGLAGFPVVIPKGLVCPCLEFEESSCDSSLTGTEECCLMVRSSGNRAWQRHAQGFVLDFLEVKGFLKTV